MKHWTEPNGIFLIKIPVDWQYVNPLYNVEEKSPYSFQPYEQAIGCFQISCYPLSSESPKIAKANPNGVKTLNWKESRMDNEEACIHLFYGALGDQALIGKYIYNSSLKDKREIQEELRIVRKVLESVVIVPGNDRKLASDLDKLDRFTASLAATHDLLSSAIDSESFVEIIIVSANQIDAYLRLSIVIAKQIRESTDEIDIKYLFQADNERGPIERKIFEHALNEKVIGQSLYEELCAIYNLRNRVIHRFVISDIKTRDLIDIAAQYLKITDVVCQVLRELEDKQKEGEFGVYGQKLFSAIQNEDMAVQHLHASINDKHLLTKFNRKIEGRKT